VVVQTGARHHPAFQSSPLAPFRLYNDGVNVSGRARLSALMLAALTLGGLAAWGFINYAREPELTPELRGYALAEELGCHGCHGPRGTGGVVNPGSRDGEVPAWDGGTAMMFVRDDDEIREWIMDGKPWRLVLRDSLDARRRADEKQRVRDSFPKPGEVSVRPRPLEPARLPLTMPAYRDVIDAEQLEDLVAYYKAVADFTEMPDDARTGYRAARSLGCFGCHGPGGLLGVENPRSFKGYVPPWRGPDFKELVKNDDELRAWILDGNIQRFNDNRIARYFMRRQVVRMPAYRGVIADSTLADVEGYIRWLSSQGRDGS
jgi:mono/diheme cytochrome c family protein